MLLSVHFLLPFIISNIGTTMAFSQEMKLSRASTEQVGQVLGMYSAADIHGNIVGTHKA